MTKKTKKPRQPRKVTIIDGKHYTSKGLELTRCSNTMTEGQFAQFILSALRKATTRWNPKWDKLKQGRRPNQSTNKKLKWENNCEECNEWFPESQIQIDHIIPCGGLSGEDWLDKIKPWIIRAFVEIDGFRRLCKSCHLKKSLEERKK